MLPLLFLAFVLLPIAELWLIIEIGGAIGVLPTLALLIVDSLVGAALARSQSRAAARPTAPSSPPQARAQVAGSRPCPSAAPRSIAERTSRATPSKTPVRRAAQR